MTLEQLVSFILNITPLFFVKIFSIGFLILHLIFSLCLVRQTKLMTRVVEAQISPLIYLIAVIHLLSSIFILILALLL